jgi:putative membrane protein
VDDHSAANSELTQLATSKGITLPTELDTKHRADVTRLSKLSGAAFDGAYSKAMLDDHVKDVAAFEKESTSGTDPEVKAFATKTLPTLKQHLEMARSLNGQSSRTNPPTKPGS